MTAIVVFLTITALVMCYVSAAQRESHRQRRNHDDLVRKGLS